MKKIADLKGVSVRVRTICNNYGFIFIEDLVDYKTIHGGFSKLRNCGNKSITEIESLISKSGLIKENITPPNNISTDDFRAYVNIMKKSLSIRAQNSLNHFINTIHFESGYALLTNSEYLIKFKNVGRKTSDELSLFFHKIYSRFSNNNLSTHTKPSKILMKDANLYTSLLNVTSCDYSQLEETIDAYNTGFANNKDNITAPKISSDDFRCYVNIIKNSLSIRAQNALKHFIDTIHFESGYSLLTNSEYFIKFENVGRKTSKELSLFFQNLYSQISNNNLASPTIPSHVLLREVNFYTKLVNETSYDYSRLEEIRHTYNVESLLDLDLLSIIHVAAPTFFNDRELEILFKRYDNKEELNLIAEEYNLSRERIRQICLKVEQKTKNFADSLLSKFIAFEISPQFITEKDVLFENDFTNNQRIPSSLLMETVSYITKYSFFKKNKLRNISSFILSDYIASSIDIESMIDHISSVRNSRLSSDYLVSVKSLIDDYKKTTSADRDRLFESIEIILKRALCVTVKDGFVTIARKLKKKDFEFIREILVSHQKPMHVDKILDELIRLGHKNKRYTSASVGGHCRKHSDVFILTSSSTYGLKAWEEEKGLMGGTIKQIIKQYLQEHDCPMHIFEIFNFVKKYRNTNKHSVWSNINSDPQKIFVVFEAGFIGLKEKKYVFSDTNFKGVSNHWYKHFLNKYVSKGRSKYTLNEVIISLANDLKVKPVQIQDKIEDRISKGDLYLDDQNYLHTTIESINKPRIILSDLEKKILLSNKEEKSPLEMISLCIELLSMRDQKVSITDAKHILDSI